MSSFSWHVDNPLTGKDSWDVSDSTVVKSVLPGGVNHDKFIGWLDKVADYLNSIQTSEGVKVPVLFRLGMNIREVGSGGERICAQLKIIKRFGE